MPTPNPTLYRDSQEAQIVSALSGQGRNRDAPGVRDMQKRVRMEVLLGGMQGYDPQRDDASLIPNDFRHLMFGRYR